MSNLGPNDFADVLATNVEALVSIAGKDGKPIYKLPKGFSLRTLAHIREGKHSPTLRTLVRVAKSFGLAPWMLLIPDLPAELVQENRLAHVLHDYLKAHKAGKEAIEAVAASYRTTSPAAKH